MPKTLKPNKTKPKYQKNENSFCIQKDYELYLGLK